MRRRRKVRRPVSHNCPNQPAKDLQATADQISSGSLLLDALGYKEEAKEAERERIMRILQNRRDVKNDRDPKAQQPHHSRGDLPSRCGCA